MTAKMPAMSARTVATSVRWCCALGGVVVAGLALSGCGSGPAEPGASSFTASPVCRQAAGDLLAIAKTTRHSASGTELSSALTPPQKRLLALPDASAVQPVTTAIGFLRIRAVANTYTDDLRGDVRTATQQLIDHCSGRTAS